MVTPFISATRTVGVCNPIGLQKKCFILKDSFSKRYSYFGNNKKKDVQWLFRGYEESFIFIFCSRKLPSLSNFLKSSSVSIVKNCLEQVEFVIAHRIRRGQQMVTLYTRLWDERALKHLLSGMRRMLHRRGKQFLMGSALAVFNWDKERIPIEELTSHIDEMKICEYLRTKALEGEKTKCISPDCTCPECNSTTNVDCWEPFIIEEGLTVWKMEDANYKNSGLYCYKMYGKYNDVTANDFLEVSLDIDHRTKWDSHAADLKLIDSEPSTQSDVIYWETKWPTLFSNRDYVFKRRYYKDEKKKVAIIMNKSTEHPAYPPSSHKARVTEYWSYMVIKANSGFDEPGMEFSLTYFDNPGISLPNAISLWVTVQGMPEYMKRLKIEALAMGKRRKEREVRGGGPVEPTPSEEPQSPPSSPPPPTSPAPLAANNSLSPYEYVFILSAFFQKLKTSLWL